MSHGAPGRVDGCSHCRGNTGRQVSSAVGQWWKVRDTRHVRAHRHTHKQTTGKKRQTMTTGCVYVYPLCSDVTALQVVIVTVMMWPRGLELPADCTRCLCRFSSHLHGNSVVFRVLVCWHHLGFYGNTKQRYVNLVSQVRVPRRRRLWQTWLSNTVASNRGSVFSHTDSQEKCQLNSH